MSDPISQLIGYVIQLAVAWIIWKHYQGSVYPVEQKYSTFAPRFWTGFVDSCVLWPVSFLVELPVLFGKFSPLVAASTVLLQNMIWLAYTITMHTQRGQTVGKIVCKVRVVDNATEGPLTLGQATLRESIPMLMSVGMIVYQMFLVARSTPQAPVPPKPAELHLGTLWLVSAVPLLWFLAEVITMLSNPKRRALHDFLAGTAVVRTNLKTSQMMPLVSDAH